MTATNNDILDSLDSLRKDVKRQGSDIRKLVEQHNDHEKRLKELEPVKAGYRSLIECNDHLVHEIRALKESQEGLMNEMAARVERSLRTDILEMRRELRTELARIASLFEKHLTEG